MLPQRTLFNTSGPTSSAALADGNLPCGSPGGLSTVQSIPEAAHVSPTHKPARVKRTKTPAISGPPGCRSFASDDLSALLASKSQMRLGMAGSMEYSQTWKQKTTPAGRLYWEHTASAVRTSDSDCGGWPTPAVQNADGGPNPNGNTGEHFTLQTAAVMVGWPTPDTNKRGGPQDAAKRKAGGHTVNLQDAALMAGWPTPQVCEGPNNGTNRGDGKHRARHTPQNVPDLLGWGTPSSRDHKDSGPALEANHDLVETASRLPRQVLGATSESSIAETGNRGVLNPAHSRWLMGFPRIWDESAPGWKEWDSVQKQLSDCFGTPEAFSLWLLEIALADSAAMETPLFPK